MQELVSIITPCYNSEEYIQHTIQSVLAQTYTNWELIIIDDCSSDSSADIIGTFVKQDSRIKYFRTECPSGSPTMPRNIGIDNAKGRYIAFLDSDDIWLPTKLHNQVGAFNRSSNIAIVYSYYEKINDKGERENRVIKSPKEISYSRLLYGNVIGNLTGIYDTSKVGKISMKYIGHEDYAMWLEILKKGFIGINTNTVEALYRIRSSSISSNKFTALSWTWNIYRKEEGLSMCSSIYYFVSYAIRAIFKQFI